MAHKVLRDGTFKTAKDYSELGDYVVDNTAMLMESWMKDGERGILEGSQGALLSLNHGYYPYCTSKDVTPAALLAEAGIATRRVRDIWAVYRAVVMRVPGHSGPSDGEEITWAELEAAIGKFIPKYAKVQTDSGDKERVFLWSWTEFKKSLTLIGPDYIALTFADWWPTPLMKDHPTLDDLLLQIHNVANCPVGLVRNGPGWNDYIRPSLV